MRRYISPPDEERYVDPDEVPYRAIERLGEDDVFVDGSAALDLVERTIDAARDDGADDEVLRALGRAEIALVDALDGRADEVVEAVEARIGQEQEVDA